MVRYLVLRLLQSGLILIVMSFAVYALIGLMPGDPVDLMISADPRVTSEDAASLRALYGLDRPIFERYAHWLADAVGGDFGYSRLHAAPVLDVLMPAIGNTAVLMGASLALSVALALPAGFAAAARPYSRFDYVVNIVAFAGISVPSFWLALLLIMVFAVILGWLPAGGMGTVGAGGLADQLRFLALPVLSLTLASVGSHIRYARAAMIDTLRQDHIRTARAKGLAEGRVVVAHALRNAMIPVATILALDFGTLFSGALVTETIFAYPGMGKLIFDAIMGNDFNLALVALLFATVVTLFGNLLADFAYVWLDPRLSLREVEA
ncbi:MAG: ABC transporter permease [Rhodospirillales bacterium]|nr:ABC transporter permease [Rhodospirillales bacterium]